MRSLVLLTLAAVLSPAAATQTVDSLARARQLTEWFYAGQMDSVLAYAIPEVRQEGAAELNQRLAFLRNRAGTELRVLEERFVRRNGDTQYWRTGWWSDFADDTITFRLVIVNGLLAGMGVNPTGQNPPIDPPR